MRNSRLSKMTKETRKDARTYTVAKCIRRVRGVEGTTKRRRSRRRVGRRGHNGGGGHMPPGNFLASSAGEKQRKETGERWTGQRQRVRDEGR